MDFWLHLLNLALVLSVLGFSLNLLVGYTGLLSMMHAAIYGVGGYAAAVGAASHGVPFPLTVAGAVVLACAFSLLTAWPALRVRGEYLILLTLALQAVASGVFVAWVDVTGGSSGLGGIGRPTVFGTSLVRPIHWLPVISVVFVVGWSAAYWVGHSPFGRVLKAIREDETATESLGKHVVYHKIAVFGVSGALAGLAGGTFAHYQAFVSPTSFSLDASIFLIAVVVLGGTGNLLGTVVGAVVLTVLPEGLRFLDLGSQFVGVIQKFLYGTLLVVFMIYRPKGLIPEGASLRAIFGFRRGGSPGDTDADPRQNGSPSASPSGTGTRGGDGRAGGPRPVETRAIRPTAGEDGSPADARDAIPLEAADLHKSFGGVKPADGIDVSLRAGTVTALVGPNGAGKTTLFNLLTGFVSPERGSVKIDGRAVTDLPPWKRVRLGLARSWQDVRLFQGLSVLDNVLLAVPEQEGEDLSTLFGRPLLVRRRHPSYVRRALDHLAFVGMEGRAESLVSSLAHGEQKLVSMARLAATEADILLLDEPASGIDRSWVNRILDLIRELAEQGCTICIVEHNLEVVRAVAERAYFMDAGRIVAEGTPEELITDPELADRYFGRSGR